jgi:Anaphase-promoting complex subunit 11 RING-H2 finger
MRVKVKRWHGVAVWKWEIVDEDVSEILNFVSVTKWIIVAAIVSLSMNFYFFTCW